MIQRCLNPKHKSYSNYGGRGITVCERWKKFANFLADMGERPPDRTLDREDGSKDYCKENCTWADLSTQNTRRRKWPQAKSRVTGKFIGSEDQEDASDVGDTSFEF